MNKYILYALCFSMLQANVIARMQDDQTEVVEKKTNYNDGSKKTHYSKTTHKKGKNRKRTEEREEKTRNEKVRRGHITGRKKFIQGREENDDRTRITGRKKQHIVSNLFGGHSDEDDGE